MAGVTGEADGDWPRHGRWGPYGPARAFDSPEEAALADWPQAARTQVVSVQVRGDRAEVVLDTDPHYPYWVYCVRTPNGWVEHVSGNGPTVGWDNPEQTQWSR